MPELIGSTVEVAIAMAVPGTYTYSVPEALQAAVAPGVRVLVSFGRRRVTGYLLGPGAPPGQIDIKPVLKILDDGPVFPAAMLPLFRWAADYYKHPLGAVIQTALPGGLTVAESAAWSITAAGRERLDAHRLPVDEARVLALLARKPAGGRLGPGVPGAVLASLERRGCIQRTQTLRAGAAKALQERWARLAPGAPPDDPLSPKKRALRDVLAAAGELPVRTLAPQDRTHLRALERSGRVEIFTRRMYRDPFGEAILPDAAPALTTAQETVVAPGDGHRAVGARAGARDRPDHADRKTVPRAIRRACGRAAQRALRG